MGSPWIVNWLGERDRQDLLTITRCLMSITIITSTITLSPRLGIDATFKVTPGNYAQLLIINARIGGEEKIIFI